MRLRACLALFLPLTAAVLHAAADPALGRDQVRAASLAFGRSLMRAEVGSLRELLPQRGKVRLHLVGFGPEEGLYSGDQVEAVFDEFLRHGAVRSFDLLRVECEQERYALAHGRLRITDREGRPTEVDFHLTFEIEERRWVLRGIREAPP